MFDWSLYLQLKTLVYVATCLKMSCKCELMEAPRLPGSAQCMRWEWCSDEMEGLQGGTTQCMPKCGPLWPSQESVSPQFLFEEVWTFICPKVVVRICRHFCRSERNRKVRCGCKVKDV